MIEIIKDKKDWCKHISLVEYSDFYHTYNYHYFSKNDDETPYLIKYTEGLTTLLLPLLIRNIENSDYKDATSVYGYSGILALNIDENFEQKIFQNELNNFFNENKIVSIFTRLHPFIDYQEALLTGLGKIADGGKVVYIDLNDSIENQRAKFNRRLKTYLNKARKTCTVFEGNIEDHLETFINLYHGNMKRVDAHSSYFFDNDYFKNLLSSKDFNPELLMCRDNETQEIIGGAIFVKTGEIVQYHLSGLSEKHYNLNGIKLIIDEMRIHSTKQGFKHLNLGGGRGGNEDSLFRFKSCFSKSFKPFKLWKYIVDEKAYDMLVNDHFKNHNDTEINIENIKFFPAYRAPLK